MALCHSAKVMKAALLGKRAERRPALPLRCPAARFHPTAVSPAATLASPPSGTASYLQQAGYPRIDLRRPGLECIHAEPPVYIMHGLLSAEQCEALVAAATAGLLPELAYDNAVLLDVYRLWPLALIVGGQVFTGTKWSTKQLFQGAHANEASSRSNLQLAQAAKAAVEAFVLSTSQLLETPTSHLEAPTVTRYTEGQQQRVHFDGRPAGDPSGLAEFMEAGGQRLVQVVSYLRTLSVDQGGATAFHHPSLQGLAVRPQQGDALVFFPAFEDGTLDDRMAHSGQVVKAGATKYIINTWACQRPVPTAVQLERARAHPARRE